MRSGQPREKRALLQNYFHSVFYRDLLERFGIRARDLLEALMRCCLEEYACIFSISTFERQWKASGAQGVKTWMVFSKVNNSCCNCLPR